MIADVFAQRLAVTNITGYPPRDPKLASLWGTPPAASGAEVTTRSVLGLSAVFRGTNILGNGVAKCRPMIFQRLDDQARPDPQGRNKRRATEHAAWTCTVRRANRWMSAGEFRKTLTAWAILRGNGIAHVKRDAAGRVLEFLPLLPDRTGVAVFGRRIGAEAELPDDAEILYWTIVDGKMRTILPENILHIRGLSHNGVWGIDVIEVMRETLGLAIAARDCGARFYGQGMLGSGILYMPAGLAKGPKGEETVANFIASVKRQAQGLSRSHRLLVIEEGAKFEKLSIDPDGAQALQTREFELEEIANVIGCQAHKLGSKNRKSYASLEQSNQEHADDDVDPWLSRWDEALEETVLSEEEKDSGSHYIECNRKALLRTNLAARASYYSQARNGGWMSANDVRRAEGDDPIGEQGDVYLVPANMMPADQAGAAFTDAAAIAANADAEPLLLEDLRSERERLGAALVELKLHEVERLTTRCLEQAQRQAARGGREFVEFLAGVPAWCHQPASLRGLLRTVAGHLVEELNRFTEPPYAANDLKTNIAAAIDSIRASALALAVAELEAAAQPKGKAA